MYYLLVSSLLPFLYDVLSIGTFYYCPFSTSWLLSVRFANLDGTNRHIVLHATVPHPFAIAVFEEWMYWTDWNHKTIEKANRFTGEHRVVLHNTTHRPMDIHIYHPLIQPDGMYITPSFSGTVCKSPPHSV